MQFQLAWGARVSPEFRAEIISIARAFAWTPDHASWLMSCIAFETGETFSSSVRNMAGSGAVGLIQFMEFVAEELGTTLESLAAMTPEAQLAWVEKYFRRYAANIRSLSDMYMAILLPKYVGKPDGSVLFADGVAYRQNSGLDMDKDGRVTKAEATTLVQRKYVRGMGLAETEDWD